MALAASFNRPSRLRRVPAPRSTTTTYTRRLSHLIAATGAVVFVQGICNVVNGGGGFTVAQATTKVFVHEVGHCLGASHELATFTGAGCPAFDDRELDLTNVMAQGLNPQTVLGPAGQGPRFAADSQAQLNLANKVSVETNNVNLCRFV